MRICDVTADPAKEGSRMKTITLSELVGATNADVLRNIMDIRHEKARVYQTRVRSEEMFVFVTASKDIHLMLGQLDEMSQQQLARMMHEHATDDIIRIVQSSGEPGLVVSITKTETGSTKILLVSAN